MIKIKRNAKKDVDFNSMLERVLSKEWIAIQYSEEINSDYNEAVLNHILNQQYSDTIEVYEYSYLKFKRTIYALRKSKIDLSIQNIKLGFEDYVAVKCNNKFPEEELIIPHLLQSWDLDQVYPFAENNDYIFKTHEIKYRAINDGHHFINYHRTSINKIPDYNLESGRLFYEKKN